MLTAKHQRGDGKAMDCRRQKVRELSGLWGREVTCDNSDKGQGIFVRWYWEGQRRGREEISTIAIKTAIILLIIEINKKIMIEK